jgi:hypothetical protein
MEQQNVRQGYRGHIVEVRTDDPPAEQSIRPIVTVEHWIGDETVVFGPFYLPPDCLTREVALQAGLQYGQRWLDQKLGPEV